MNSLRIPVGVWTWKGTALVLALLLTPLLAAVSLAPYGDLLLTFSVARSLPIGIATLSAGVFLYLHWRITASTTSGWLALLLALVAVPSIALGAVVVGGHDLRADQMGWLVVVRGATTLALLGLVLVAPRTRLPADPLALGIVGGLLIAAVRQVVFVLAPPAPPYLAHDVVRLVVLTAITAGLALAVSRMEGLPDWVRRRIGVGLLLLALGTAVSGTPSLVTGLTGAVLLAATGAAVLSEAIEAEKRQLADLSERLDSVRDDIREDRARLHEIDATVAGIASAQRLIAEGAAADRTEVLNSMVSAEVERLERLLAARAPVRLRSVDLDDVLGQIVTAHRARGRGVDWQPSGHRALGRADDIAEVVNVLVDNAAVHGDPHGISVTLRASETEVVVTVADRGAGVAAEVDGHLFDWGVRRLDSPGQGIGLHVAAELAKALGGRLALEATPDGTRFALHLPAAVPEVSPDGPVVRAR